MRQMRFLFHSLPLAGHVYPIAAVARELAKRGHDVAWVGAEAFLRPLLGPQESVFPTGLRLYRGELQDFGMTATRSRWEGYVVPQTRFTLPPIQRAIEEYAPDVFAVDQHAIAGAIAAHQAKLPWATLAPTTMEITRPYRALPKVEEWIHGLMAAMWTRAAMPGSPPHDLRFSPHLVIAFTGECLTGAADGVVMVGPALSDRLSTVDFPWEWLDPYRKKVLITVGTLNLDMAKDFYGRVVKAVAPLGDRLQAILVSPEPAAPDAVPPNMLVRQQVPMLELVPRLHAVVTHGGLNTVCEALSHGVPLVVAPIKSDQPINAAHVVAAGAGIRVRFGRSPADELRDAILAVLDDPSYSLAAQRIQESFREAGGARAAADHLEQLG